MDYQTIKQEAKEQGLSIRDLCALAPQNDPFYVGAPAQIKAAEWFMDLWRQFGYGDGVHLRRVHYQIVSQDPPVLRPDGTVYENTETDWNYLCNAGKWARYLKLVSPGAFVDRRNPEAKVFASWYQWGTLMPGYEISASYDGYGYELPELPELESLPPELPDVAEFDVSGYEDLLQSYHVEVWCEKSTMNDVLLPLCRRYHVNFVTGLGEMSITAVVDFLKRARNSERPARILYISDYDPAGLGMPISVAVKVQFFQQERGYNDLDIRLQPIALTVDQVDAYDLPKVPVKDSDKRKANWQRDHGRGQVELDALEALHPGELGEIVEAAILDYYDPTLQKRADKAKWRLTKDLDSERAGIIASYQDELDTLDTDYQTLVADFDGTRERFADLVAEFQPDVDAYQERLDAIKERAAELYGAIDDDLGAVDLDLDSDDYKLPETELPEESDDKLYSSERGYFEQLDVFSAYRHGENGQ